jgi:hypothetical protein
MECAIISTKDPRARRNTGMSLIEMLVATGLGGLVLSALAMITVFTARSFVAMGNYVDLDKDSRNTLDLMSSDIRQADSVISYATNQLVLTNAATATRLSYTYDAPHQQLVRTNGASVTTNLVQCESFLFTYWTDITITNTFDQYPATGTNDLKMVQVAWRCFRTVIGKRNTESIQSAKIMIRKQ